MSFLEIDTCNICGKKDIRLICHIPEFPTILRPLSEDSILDLKNKNIPTTMPLRVGICTQCGHMLLLLRPSDQILKSIYECLYETYVSGLELGFATADADEFLSLFRGDIAPNLKNGSRVLEIGCYDGYILSHLLKDGFEVLGCDPSNGAVIGQEKGIPILRAFYSPDLFQSRFDVVMNRHLVEHFANPVHFLASIREIMKESGYLILETPNGLHYLENDPLGPFHLEHLSVFTPVSLSFCLKRADFRIREIFNNSRNLRVICTLGEKDENGDREVPKIEKIVNKAIDLNHRIGEYMSRLNSFVEDFAKKGKRVAVWGAGSSGIGTLSLAPTLSKIIFAVVDRDPKKHGLSFFNLNNRVMPPEYLGGHPADVIIVCSQYYSEILNDIRNRYGFRSAVLLLTPDIKIVK